MIRPAVAVAAAALVLPPVLAGCGGGDGAAEPAAFEGAWDVSLVVGSVDADPGADPAAFPGDATYRERWVFDACDAEGCTLRRPDSGLLLGDLDGVRFEYRTRALEDEERFIGEGQAAEGTAPGDDPCAGTATRRWSVRIEIGVRDDVLSGTVARTPEARALPVGGTTCYGLDLTLGLSGVPAAAGPAGPAG